MELLRFWPFGAFQFLYACYNFKMTSISGFLSPILIALSLMIPFKLTHACDLKNCPHDAKAKACDCSCGGEKQKDGTVKAHSCGPKACKKANCANGNAKSCKHHSVEGGNESAHKT
jgi:hypothetical protein